MNYDELLRNIEENSEEIFSLSRILEKLKNTKKELSKLYISSAFFNTKDISKIIAKLISYKEGKEYKVLEWNNNDFIYVRNYCAICDNEKYDYYYNYFSNGIHEISREQSDILLMDNYSYDDIDPLYETFNNRNISFDFLWSQYKFNNADYDYYDINLCKSNFNNYEYVKGFIYYLFNIQIMNNGKHLNYNELDEALNNYINLEKNKKRIKKN